jgi:ring-1,2-phenylacetyl-CoA epoxidase subunit PaaC
MNLQEAKFRYVLRLGDNALVLGHRLSEWCGHGPALEEDMAIINVSLDLLGQCRNLLAYAGRLEGKGRTEDDLAYLRLEKDFTNALICELPNGHYGDTIVRQYLYDQFNFLLWSELTKSTDPELAAIAAKTIKEVTYHLRHSRDWMLRLGDGTPESHGRMQQSLDEVWMFTGDMFATDDSDALIAQNGIGPDMADLRNRWLDAVRTTVAEATLTMPTGTWMQSGSRIGRHTEHFGYLLTELQYMQRAYPGCEW